MRNSPFLKGQSGAAIAAIVIVFVIIGALVFLAPGLFSGFSLGGGGFTGLVGPGTQGVVIKSFTADVPNAEKDIPVSFTLEVENRGGKEATDVNARLFGLPTSEWTFSPSNRQFFSNLRLDGVAADGSIQGIEQAIVDATPTATKSTDTNYAVAVRVKYDYDTDFEGTVEVASRDYIRSVTPAGTTQPGVRITNSKSTLGPLTVTARTTSSNLNAGTQTIRVIFDITNTGGGRVFDRSATDPTDSNLDKIEITTSGYPTTTCSTTDTRLISAQSRTITCDVRVTVTNDEYTPYTFGIKVRYGYFVDSTVPITLLRTIE
jgi:hypothetical protein